MIFTHSFIYGELFLGEDGNNWIFFLEFGKYKVAGFILLLDLLSSICQEHHPLLLLGWLGVLGSFFTEGRPQCNQTLISNPIKDFVFSAFENNKLTQCSNLFSCLSFYYMCILLIFLP